MVEPVVPDVVVVIGVEETVVVVVPGVVVDGVVP